MNEVPPSRPALITFAIADERGRLPVALGGEPVAVGHQPLRCDAGQLRAGAPRSSKVSVKARKPPRVEELAQTGLDARRVAQRLPARAAGAQSRSELVRLLVLRDETVDLRVGNGRDRRPRDRRRRSR